MKKQMLTSLLSYFISTTAMAQAKDMLAFISETVRSNEPTAVSDAPVSYKNYVGVYVRAKVMRQFLDLFPDAADVRWHHSNSQYFASFVQQGHQCRALFDVRGTLVYGLRTGSQLDLPRDASRQLKALYPRYTITIATEVTTPTNKAWIVNLEDADNLRVVQIMDDQLEELRRYQTHF